MAECMQVNTGDLTSDSAVNMDMDDKQFTCHICMENYTNPRYLPTCGHTFCEQCLLAYSRNLQKQGSKLECPVCRKPQSFPENGDEVTLEWVQTFPLNTAIVKMMGTLPEPTEIRQDMKENRHACEPCEKKGEAVDGENFCLDCKEILCRTCSIYHKRFKMSEHHKLLSCTQLSSVAGHEEFFTSFTNCEQHAGKEIEFYCEAHEIVICSICLRNMHKTCATIEISSPDTVTNYDKIRKITDKLMSGMKAAVDNLNMLQKIKADNKTSLSEKMKTIRENVSQVRDQVVELMEKIVRHVSDVTKQLDLECENALDNDISRMQKIKELAVEKLAPLDTIVQQGSERHAFVSAHYMLRQFEKIEVQIEKEDMNLNIIDADLKLADEIRKMIESTEVEKLVDVTLSESKSCHGCLDYVANQLRDCPLVKMSEHKVRLVSQCSPEYPEYSGVAIQTDGRVILCDGCHSNRGCGFVCLYNPTDKSQQRLKLNKPSSATQIDDTYLAICLPDSNSVVIVTVDEELKVEKTLQSQRIPQSIVSLSNGDLAISWSGPPAFSMIDISGAEIVEKSYLDQDTSGRSFKSFTYFAVDERRQHVIQSCHENKTVYCLDFAGDPIFSFKDPTLTAPRGVALDKCGNIYVCNRDCRIYRLSPGGGLINIVSVPFYPRAICCDDRGNGFWVTQENYTVVYFRLDQDTKVCET